MCNKLVQSFACGHSKTICSTPCVHALRQHITYHQELAATSSSPSTGSSSVHTLGRSDSVKSYASSTGLLLRRNVSKLTLMSKGKAKAKAKTWGDESVRSRAGSDASVRGEQGQSAALVPGTGRGRRRGMAVTTTAAMAVGTMPTVVMGTTTPTRTQTTPTTPWPSISPSTPRSHQNNVEGGVGGGPGLRFAVPHSAVSSTSVDAPVPVSSLSPGTPVSPFTPTTATTTTTASRLGPGSGSGSGSGPLAPPENIEPAQNSAPYGLSDPFALGDGVEEPLFCDYYFPRCLTSSQYPCRECYGKEEWEGLRKKWIESYRLGHPMDVLGEAEVERLSGVVLFVEAEGEGKVELDGVGKAV